MKVWTLIGYKAEKKVVLASAETDADVYFLGVRRLRVMTECLGIIHLASYLESQGWKFDPAYMTDENMFAENCQDAVVGISTQINNYGNSLKLAATAKANGAKLVVMGGPHATNVAEQIICNQPDVDIVVRGQGEVALYKILEAESFTRGVVEEKHLPFHLLPPRNRGLWSQIWKAEDVNLSRRKWSMISFTEGCPQAQSGNPCVFCSIRHAKKFSCRMIEQMVEEMKQLQSLGIGALEVGDDDFPGVFSKKQLGKLLDAIRVAGIDLKFFIHARVVSIVDLEHLEMLKEMGVEIIQTGFESGDAEIKTLIGISGKTDKATLEQEDRLIEWCKQIGIKFQATFVAGIPSETMGSMQKTLNRAKELVEKNVLWALMIDPLIPLPGSRAFGLLCKKHSEFASEDRINTERWIKSWFQDFTTVDLQKFLGLRTELLSQLGVTVAGMLLKI
jgi:radical SAM superfamily enzyme YgiQ (UPF0313 family)